MAGPLFDQAQLGRWSDALGVHFFLHDMDPLPFPSEPKNWICEVCKRPSCEGTHMVLPDGHRPGVVHVESLVGSLALDHVMVK